MDTPYLAIFDGNGGEAVPKFCKRFLHEEIRKTESLLKSDADDIEQECSNLSTAINEGFMRMDEMIRENKFWGELNEDGIPYQSKTFIASMDESGSTASVVVLRRNRLITANAGLSRCIIIRKDETFEMTTDHSSDTAEEKKRIDEAKSFVSDAQTLSDEDTVMEDAKLEYTFSRAIGYLKYKKRQDLPVHKQIMIARPSIKIVEIKGDIEYIVLASSNFWDRVTDILAMRNIRRWTTEGFTLSQICTKLRRITVHKGLAPEIMTIIIIKLESQEYQKPPKESTIKPNVEDLASWEKLSKRYILAQDKSPEEVREILTVALLRATAKGDDRGPKFTLPSRAPRLYEYNPELKQVCLRRSTSYDTRKPQKGMSIERNIKIVLSLLERRDTTSVKTISYRAEKVCSHKQSESALREISLLTGCPRSSLNVYGTPKGSIYGAIVLISNGRSIDCQGGGTAAMKIPVEVEKGRGKIEVHCKEGFIIDYILLVEKESVFLTLMETHYPTRNNCVLVTGSGMPDVATRTVMHSLVASLKVPAYCLVDGNPYGMRIFSVYKFGSRQLASETTGLTLPTLKLIGLFPEDIERMSKSARQELSNNDMNVLNGLLRMSYLAEDKILMYHLGRMESMRLKAQLDSLQDDLGFIGLSEYVKEKIERETSQEKGGGGRAREFRG